MDNIGQLLVVLLPFFHHFLEVILHVVDCCSLVGCLANAAVLVCFHEDLGQTSLDDARVRDRYLTSKHSVVVSQQILQQPLEVHLFKVELSFQLFKFSFGVRWHFELLAPFIIFLVMLQSLDHALSQQGMRDELLKRSFFIFELEWLVEMELLLLGVADLRADSTRTGCVVPQRHHVFIVMSWSHSWIVRLWV